MIDTNVSKTFIWWRKIHYECELIMNGMEERRRPGEQHSHFSASWLQTWDQHRRHRPTCMLAWHCSSLLNYEPEYILLQLNHSVRYFCNNYYKVTHTQKQGGMLILQKVLQFNKFYWRKQWFNRKDFPKNVGSNISESIKGIVTHIQEEDALYLQHI